MASGNSGNKVTVGPLQSLTTIRATEQAQDQYERIGLAPKTSTPQELAAFNKEQVGVWGHLVKVSGLQPG